MKGCKADVSYEVARQSAQAQTTAIAACQNTKDDRERARKKAEDERRARDEALLAQNKRKEEARARGEIVVIPLYPTDPTPPVDIEERRGVRSLCTNTAFVEGDLCEDGSASGYKWSKSTDLTDGEKVIGELRAQVAAKTVVRSAHVFVNVDNAEDGKARIARCDVLVIHGVVGPPLNCMTVAIIDERDTFIRSRAIRGEINCLVGKSFTIDGTTDISWQVAKVDASKLGDALYDLLHQKMAFEVDKDVSLIDGHVSRIDFAATTNNRLSEALKDGNRESIELHLQVIVRGGDIRVSAYTKPLICRQAACSMPAYHYPSDAQRQVYATYFNNEIAKSIRNTCGHVASEDATHITCQ